MDDYQEFMLKYDKIVDCVGMQCLARGAGSAMGSMVMSGELYRWSRGSLDCILMDKDGIGKSETMVISVSIHGFGRINLIRLPTKTLEWDEEAADKKGITTLTMDKLINHYCHGYVAVPVILDCHKQAWRNSFKI